MILHDHHTLLNIKDPETRSGSEPNEARLVYARLDGARGWLTLLLPPLRL